MDNLQNNVQLYIKDAIKEHKYDEVLNIYLYLKQQDPSITIRDFFEFFEVNREESLAILRSNNKSLKANQLVKYTENVLDINKQLGKSSLKVNKITKHKKQVEEDCPQV